MARTESTTIPDGTGYVLFLGSHYKRGRHGHLLRWSGYEWACCSPIYPGRISNALDELEQQASCQLNEGDP